MRRKAILSLQRPIIRSLSSSSALSITYPTDVYIGDEVAAWEDLGFNVSKNGIIQVGEVSLHLCGVGYGRGVIGWNFANISPNILMIDGIPILRKERNPEPAPAHHPNGVEVIDHIVIKSKNGLQTEKDLNSIGILLRRRNEDNEKKMMYSFYRPSKTILEVLSPLSTEEDSHDFSPSKIIGITFTSSNLQNTHSYLSKITKPPWPALQKGREITTIQQDLTNKAGDKLHSIRIAFLSPHVK